MSKVAAIVLSGLVACGLATGAAKAEGTVVDIVLESGEPGDFDSNPFDYDLLLQAVVTADLVDALSDEDADLTVFAPNDFAFIRLAHDLGYDGKTEAGTWEFLLGALTDLGGGDPLPVLTAILTYHVAPEPVDVIDFLFLSILGQPIVTLQGGEIQPFFFSIIDNDPDFRNPTLFLPLNVQASNGIIHTISRVLLPLDI